MTEHGMYFASGDFYALIRNNGGQWNDSKERPIVCLIKSKENDRLYWAIPVGNWNHRDEAGKKRIMSYIGSDQRKIQSCFYHIGNTTVKSIFFISDAVPITDKYIDREYLGYDNNQYVILNPVLISELERKLKRILKYESSRPNFFRQHITDIKNYLLDELLKSNAIIKEYATVTFLTAAYFFYSPSEVSSSTSVSSSSAGGSVSSMTSPDSSASAAAMSSGSGSSTFSVSALSS